MDRTVRTVEDVLSLLDGLFTSPSEAGCSATGDGKDFWDRFYADRSRAVPFFAAKPDENLAAYLDQGLIAPGRVLDLGCGPGRNALFLAARGFAVDAVDLSPMAVAWGEERAHAAEVEVRFIGSVLRGYPGRQVGEESKLLRSRAGEAGSPPRRTGVRRLPADSLCPHGN
ncbi:class I SAM-dependent methyltransferase [Streptomyces sp. NBC_00490]|uniref:class I SAM-dependent methyltransferase n=1 Tax=Streptomyces sp. NBC_00490 TaxID=2903657 RepID=UPI003FCE9C46